MQCLKGGEDLPAAAGVEVGGGEAGGQCLVDRCRVGEYCSHGVRLGFNRGGSGERTIVGEALATLPTVRYARVG